MVKLSVVVFTVSATVEVCALPVVVSVAVIVTDCAPVAMLGSVEIETLTLFAVTPSIGKVSGFTLVWLPSVKAQVTPVGPVHVTFTESVDPASGVIVTVDEADCPAFTVAFEDVGETVNVGLSNAFQARASWLTFTEPRPVTRL